MRGLLASMTAMLTRPDSGPEALASESDRCLVLCDPRPDTVVAMSPGCQLGIRFRRRLGLSRWSIETLPSYLLPLVEDGHEICLLVFGSEVPVPLRLVRRRPDDATVLEETEVLVVVTDAARTSTTASRRSA